MELKGKKVFVTGAAGFIGSHLVETLVKEGAQVTALVHYNSRNSYQNLELTDPKILREIKIVFGDVTDLPFLLKETRVMDVVFHLAALIAIPYSYIAPQSYVATNIGGTLNILESGRTNSIKKIIVTSTSETYGTAKYVPIDESHPLQGQSPYSATKIAADKLAESYYLSFNLPVVTIRPFNTYGPRQSARAVIPSIITQALQKKVIKLGSLTPVRDFNFVKDTANGLVMAAKAEKGLGEVINLGTGKGFSIGEVKDLIAEILGQEIKVEEDTQRVRPVASEVLRLICDNKKAWKVIGWKPKYDLREGLKETIDFISQNLHLYKTNIYNI